MNLYSEEDQIIEENIFWFVVIISNYLMKSYYFYDENDEKEQISSKIHFKEEEFENFARYNPIPMKTLLQGGLKSDLFILNMLVCEYLPDLNYKLKNHLEIDLNLYFSSHFLTLFSELLNPDFLFNLWDILFLEG